MVYWKEKRQVFPFLSVKAQFLFGISATAVLSETFRELVFFEKLHKLNCSKLKLKICFVHFVFKYPTDN